LPALVAVLATTLAGCGPTMGWWAYVFTPKQKVDAVYDLPTGKKVMVFVDDVRKPVTYEAIKGDLTEQINRELMDNKLASEIVPYQDILKLMSSEPNFYRMPIGSAGLKLGADLVLYVHIDEFHLRDDEMVPIWQGRMGASVRVVDCRKGRLWPDDRPEGYPVPPVDTDPASNPSPEYGTVLSKVLAAKMAKRVVGLLYDHDVSTEEGIGLKRPS
jgi:hypothetical protein